MTAPTPTPSQTPEEMQFHAEAVAIHGVLGNAKCLVFVPFDAPDFTQTITQAVQKHGLWYCGLIGTNAAGEPLILCEPDADSIGVMARALPAFIRQTSPATQASPDVGNQAVEWLHSLFALDDPRPRPSNLPN